MRSLRSAASSRDGRPPRRGGSVVVSAALRSVTPVAESSERWDGSASMPLSVRNNPEAAGSRQKAAARNKWAGIIGGSRRVIGRSRRIERRRQDADRGRYDGGSADDRRCTQRSQAKDESA